jgi:hypothetical protein
VDKHFHLYMGGATNILSGTTYADAPQSIDDFMGIVGQVLNNQVYPDPVVTETAMNITALEDVNKAIYVDAGELRIMWAVCDGVCYTSCLN